MSIIMQNTWVYFIASNVEDLSYFTITILCIVITKRQTY